MVNIFVGNLSYQTNQDELHAAFAQYGAVERVNIVTDRDTGQPRGFAFVEMTERRDAETAISQLNGAELNGRANQLVRTLRHCGLRAGDAVALMCGNRPEFAEVYAACMRAGWRLTPINWHLTGGEAGYIVADCEAKAFVAEAPLAAAAREAPLVLADEPTAELDERNEELVLADLHRLRDAFGTTVVVVTHSQRVADSADRVVELHDGRAA